ncbi:MAG: hypothetical protein HC915_18690 [Anaerolineae bacterium]|nr:hypothetical protein [Anaerolineae bacterium]
MMDAKLKLEAKLVSVRQEREHLKSLLELAAAKQITTRTIKSLDDLRGVGDADIQRIGDSIRERIDRLDAEAEIASSRLENQIDETIGASELELQLEERRARLGLNKQE